MRTVKSAPALVRLFTVPEARQFLRCSENHVYRLIAAGELRAVDIAQPGSRKSKTRVREDDLAAYIDAQTSKALVLRSA